MVRQPKDDAVLGTQEKEVLYSDGATPLFVAIEETDWRRALDIAEENPDQVRTWVRSTGTENTTFTWSRWRRLPIHEACRRQAPAWLVSSLFSTFPESAYHTTQFGELPLHLAVESGAAPEVVNLIMVSNWSAIVTPDNSDRLPTDILDRGELLLLDDYRIVHESLMRCHKSYIAVQESAQAEQDALKREFNEQMTKIQQQHHERLAKEQEKQEDIEQEVTTLHAKIDELDRIGTAKDILLENAKQETLTWQEKNQSLTSTIRLLEEKLVIERKNASLLTKELESRQEELASKDDMIDCLSDDLRTIAVLHDEDLLDSVHRAEQTMRAMVSSQISLQKHLKGQANGIRNLLRSRGICAPPLSREVVQEEKDSQQERHVDANEVADALAAAAMAALKSEIPAMRE